MDRKRKKSQPIFWADLMVCIATIPSVGNLTRLRSSSMSNKTTDKDRISCRNERKGTSHILRIRLWRNSSLFFYFGVQFSIRHNLPRDTRAFFARLATWVSKLIGLSSSLRRGHANIWRKIISPLHSRMNPHWKFSFPFATHRLAIFCDYHFEKLLSREIPRISQLKPL